MFRVYQESKTSNEEEETILIILTLCKIEGIGICVFCFVDNIMVGSISNEAISGVYAANQATFIFICSSLGLISGAGIFIQQFFGAKDDEHIKQCFRYKLVASFIFLLIVSLASSRASCR